VGNNLDSRAELQELHYSSVCLFNAFFQPFSAISGIDNAPGVRHAVPANEAFAGSLDVLSTGISLAPQAGNERHRPVGIQVFGLLRRAGCLPERQVGLGV